MALNKTISIIILGLAVLFITGQYLSAEDAPNLEEINKQINNNVCEEYTTCAAYFSIVSEGLRRSDALEVAKQYDEYRDLATQFALIAAKEDRTQEMAEKVTMTRIGLAVQSMMSEIDGDIISNISVLMNEYAEHCREIMEDPEKPVKEWTSKIFERHNPK